MPCLGWRKAFSQTLVLILILLSFSNRFLATMLRGLPAFLGRGPTEKFILLKSLQSRRGCCASTAKIPEILSLKPELKTHQDLHKFSIEEVKKQWLAQSARPTDVLHHFSPTFFGVPWPKPTWSGTKRSTRLWIVTWPRENLCGLRMGNLMRQVLIFLECPVISIYLK